MLFLWRIIRMALHHPVRLMHRPRTSTITAIAVAAIFLVGAFVRLSVPALTDVSAFIVNRADCGLFVAMAHEIAGNGYIIPAIIPHYTDGGIPFAYPPLSFYLLAFFAGLTGLEYQTAVTILPPILAVLSLPLFYVLTRALGLTRAQQLLSLSLFAVASIAFREHTISTGLAEVTGLLAMVTLAVVLVSRRQFGRIQGVVIVGAALALCAMSSPGSAYGGVVLFGVFTLRDLLTHRDRMSGVVVNAAGAGLVGLLVSSWYWLPVIAAHGPDVFLTSFAGQHSWWWYTTKLVDVTRFTDSNLGVVLCALVLFGVAHEVMRRQFWLLAWLLSQLVIPREGEWLAAVPACILAGIGVAWMLDGLGKAYPWIRSMAPVAPVAPVASVAVVLVVVLTVGAWHATGDTRTLAGKMKYAPKDYAEVMREASQTLPVDAKVVLMNRRDDWTPHLLRRDVLNMWYGTEWSPDERAEVRYFNRRLKDQCEGDHQCAADMALEVFGYGDVYLLTDTGTDTAPAFIPPEGLTVPGVDK